MTAAAATTWRQRASPLALLALLATPLLLAFVAWRKLVRRRPIVGAREKFTGDAGDVTPGRLLIHGVSLGEVALMRPLVDGLQARGVPCLISSTTDTGWQGIARQYPDAERVFFPFDLPCLEDLDLELGAPVTFLVGENGTGKSTLLEAIALATRCVAVGHADLDRDPTLAPASRLASRLRLVRGTRPRTALFFRAEDAFGFVQRTSRELESLTALEEELRETYEDGSLAQQLATGAVAGQRRALQQRYGADPDAASHGESFLQLLEQRLTPGGLHLLDEPETPLSPVRILALLRLLTERLEAGAQFLIATHSPMLMALPGARILCFGDGAIRPVQWQDVEHVAITRAFLANPEAYLHRLID